MNEVKEFIESGILEMYVMGQATDAEVTEVEHMAALHDDVRNEIEEISIALERYAAEHAQMPDPTIHTFLMATLDYMDRMKKGEQPTLAPALHAGSKAADFAPWLNRKDLEPNEPIIDAYASIISHTPEMMTAIAWLKYGSPPETHTNELETFLILEGTCEITIADEVHYMKPGNVLTIPLFKTHHVRVTSDYPCKIILQRAAA